MSTSKISTLAMSLRRLYKKGSPVITKEKIDSMFEKGKITEAEHEYILGE